MPNLRTLSLVILSVISILSLGLIFHPSSPLKHYLPYASSSSQPSLLLKSNGTHPFERTVILISLDGVRADYLTRGKTPHLLSISKRGIVRFPSFPPSQISFAKLPPLSSHSEQNTCSLSFLLSHFLIIGPSSLVYLYGVFCSLNPLEVP